jgi:hypothetical protein
MEGVSAFSFRARLYLMSYIKRNVASTSTGPTGSTSSTAQPPYTPKDLGGNFKCLYCPDEPTFSSDEELKKHKDEVHGSETQGKQTNTVPGISKDSGS